jgi:uncharacterized damage-inducible protein DinB
MAPAYRNGAVGALMDEYERAASDLRRLVERFDEEAFDRILDPRTSDENCRSVQTILAHVVFAGYGYADCIRGALAMEPRRPPKRLLSHREGLKEFDAMLRYTVETLDGQWELTDERIQGIVIQSRWGVTYDLEQLLEHAIVHILRHRRQIEKLESVASVQESRASTGPS